MTYNYYAEADREAHYLFTAGFVSRCSCFRCEAANEAAAQDAYEAEIEAERRAAMTQEERDAEDAALDAWIAEREATRAAEWADAPF